MQRPLASAERSVNRRRGFPVNRSSFALAAALGALALLLPVGAGAGGQPAIAFTPTTSAGTYDFGTRAADTSLSRSFELKNTGGLATAALTITLTGASAFTKTADSCSARSLGPKKTCSVTVRYGPVGEGANDTATLTATGEKAAALTSLALTGQSEAGSADISLSAFSGLNDNVRVKNDGPTAATVTVILECPGSSGMGDDFPGEWDGAFGPPGDHWKTSKDPIPSGGSLTLYASCFGSGGYVEVYSSTKPDPDSTPNNAVTTEDDYLAIS